MKRRRFSWLAGSSVLALTASASRGFAQAQNFSALSTTTLTPMGAERTGNATGTIPAWTGGMTEVPAGTTWDPTRTLPPDFWENESPLYEVNASNMTQYANLLTDGIKSLIQNRGFSLKVYTTHRTAAAPQWVYDNTAANAGRAALNPGGGRLGFTGGYGGFPFPVPDVSDPLAAGPQIIWNHEARWAGEYQNGTSATFVVEHGAVTLATASRFYQQFPYYQQNGDLSNYNGYFYKIRTAQFRPSTVAGDLTLTWESSDPLANPVIDWSLLLGQGRLRKDPEVEYDTPSSYANGECNYDEYFGFFGSLDRYDWKYLGKQEMLIPYNNNKMMNTPHMIAHTPNHLNPDVVRWELHRVWVVEATLHEGERNVLARRRFYVDEDTWMIGVTDSWDANDKLTRNNQVFNVVYPNLPGTIYSNNVLYNLVSGAYVSIDGAWGDAPYNGPTTFTPSPPSAWDPQAMAAASSY